MKNKTLNNDSYNGIKIVNNLNFTIPKSKKIINIVPLIVIAFFGTYGTILSFFSMFKINIDMIAVRFYAILFFSAFTIVYMLPRKLHLLILPGLAIYVYLIYRKWSEFIIGFKMLFNQAYLCIYPNAGKYFNVKSNDYENIELFAAFIIFLLASLICSNIFTKPNFLLGFIFTFPVIEAGLYFGKSPSIFYALMLFIFWITLFVLNCCGYFQNFQKNNSVFIRKNNTFTSKPGIKFQTAGSSVSVIAIICVVIFALTAVLSAITGYKRPDTINNLRSDLKLAASEFSFDNLGESLEKFSATLGFGKNKFYSHKLGNIGKVNFKNNTEITINTDDKFDDNIYLKGYTGTVYAGNEWTSFSEGTYDRYKYIFDDFERNSTYPQDMLTSYILSRYAPSLVTMNIKSDYQNEKYNYTPYVSIPSGTVTYTKDTDAEFEDKNNYSFKVNKFQISLTNFTDILSGMNYGINESFDEYAGFVYKNYCSIPDTEGLQEVYDRFVRNSVLDSDENIYIKLQYIEQILSENAEYTLNPGVTPGSEDYVNYFLLKNHKGYCMHFATSGIILARMAGIPARYAEGYVLHASDFNNNSLNDDGTYTVEIKDSRAHAWAEIYFERLGWVPFEFTPPSSVALNDSRQTAETAHKDKKITETTASKPKNTNTSKASGSLTRNSFSSSGVNKKTTQTQNISTLNLKHKVALLFAVAVIIIFAVITIRHIIALSRRNDILNNGEPKDKVTCAYLSTVELLEFCGIERDNMQYLEFAEFAEDRFPELITPEGFKEVTRIMLKAQMSEYAPTESEIHETINFYKELFNKIFLKSNILKKISMKYLKNL